MRPDDAARITVERGSKGIALLELNLSERSDATHCLVSLPALPNELPPPPTSTRVWARASYEDADSARLPFVLYVAGFRDGRSIGQVPTRYFAGPQECSIVLDVVVPAGAEHYQLVLYADRRYRGTLRLRDLRVVAGDSEYGIGEGSHITMPVDLKRHWRQEGTRAICRSTYGEHWAEMPPGWRLDDVHPAALAAAEWILYSEVDRLAFGVAPPVPHPKDEYRRDMGTSVLLSYSLGTDSTAAMSLLPDNTIRYYCRRPYASYVTRTGASVPLPDPSPWTERLKRLDNLIVVPNTFEQIHAAAGGRHGFAHRFGYAAIGLLLADHTNAGVLAFGSVLEQVFLRSGHLFTDVIALERSAFHSLRQLLNIAGLFLALPTGGCSEVLTSRISEIGRFAGLAISCPRASSDGAPCRTCFKCFRKLRLEAHLDAPAPEDAVVHLLEKYPLKSATSVVYAAQRSGYHHPALDEYRDVELGFLERYFDYAVEHMLPPALRSHVRRQFAALAIQPMSDEDELRLRTIAQVFWPESFSWSRAGFAEAHA